MPPRTAKTTLLGLTLGAAFLFAAPKEGSAQQYNPSTFPATLPAHAKRESPGSEPRVHHASVLEPAHGKQGLDDATLWDLLMLSSSVAMLMAVASVSRSRSLLAQEIVSDAPMSEADADNEAE